MTDSGTPLTAQREKVDAPEDALILRLQELFADVVAEPVPARLAELLNDLDGGDMPR